MVTIPMLNEIAGAAVKKRLGVPSSCLHGILPQSLSMDLTLVLFPYGMLLNAICSDYSERCDKEFRKGFWQLHDLMLHLLRSLQHLGTSTQRLRDKALADFHDFQSHPGEGTWETEIDLKAPDGGFHIDIDKSILIDSCMVYLRVLGDCVAKTIPAAFQGPPFRFIQKGSLNDLRKSLRKSTATPLGEAMSQAPIEWLDILARIVSTNDKGMREGIRDARVHHGACHSMIFEFSASLDIELIAKQGSVAGLHSADLIGDLKSAIEGFFAFLDHITREAVSRNPKLDMRTKEYSKNGHLRIFGPADFLSAMIPLLKDNRAGSTSANIPQ
jgi:hypothetical protein